MYNYPKDEILIKSVRDGLVDEAHSGFIVFANQAEYKNLKGEAGDYPFYMRSCAKPLQAALLIDYGMDEFYQMTVEEIALCCASHAGEKVHTDILQCLLDKIGLDESCLKCSIHEPLSKTRQKELDYIGFNQLHNNCSGKHTMMLGLCKMNGWDIKNYDEPKHPLQIVIREKIYELCEVKTEYPMTTDGCGVPIVSMPLHNMLKGYLSMFCSKKYKKIRDAFLNHPYLIGGEDRTDTKIISQCGLIAKVGAGGLCIVINPEKSQGFIVKVTDCDMKARELVVIDLINKLGWADIEADTSIKTLSGKIVGHYEF
ncbi:MAG: asparaginase [Candidatus Gastranaerophilales bacterium]|nr:asparaginase [Candidatus Gastranaerophilales bacterium]